MAIPEYTDPRAHKHFQIAYVGRSSEGNVNGYSQSWDSMSGASPTSVFNVGKASYIYHCAYCGKRAFPIQNPDNYDTVGYCCVCKDAMDELEYLDSYHALVNKQADELHALHNKAPRMNESIMTDTMIKVAKALKEAQAGKQTGRIDNVNRLLDNLKINLSSPVANLRTIHEF